MAWQYSGGARWARRVSVPSSRVSCECRSPRLRSPPFKKTRVSPITQKNPRAHKNKIGPPPQKKPKIPIKFTRPFPAPELRTKILRTRGFFWITLMGRFPSWKSSWKAAREEKGHEEVLDQMSVSLMRKESLTWVCGRISSRTPQKPLHWTKWPIFLSCAVEAPLIACDLPACCKVCFGDVIVLPQWISRTFIHTQRGCLIKVERSKLGKF